MANTSFDVVVLGAGPAGYVAAIRCAQLGLKTACVDNWIGADGKHALGGTCLNAGCIPSKALLESSEAYYRLRHEMSQHGIAIDGVALDIDRMQSRKQEIVARLTDGIAGLFKANSITAWAGRGRLLAGKRVEVTLQEGGEPVLLEAENVIIATGSRPMAIDGAPIDGERIVDSSGGLAFAEVPGRLAVIGAGVIGLELGSVWSRLGSQVTLFEAQQQFLPMVDRATASEAQRQFKAQGLTIQLGARVLSTSLGKKQISVVYQNKEGEHRLLVDRLLVAVGRRPNTDDLFAPDVDLLLNAGGFVHVDDYCRTNLPGVYAIGDVVRGPMLAHKGSEEGMAVAETIAGTLTSVDLERIPSVIYTNPEIAWVGKSEQTLKTQGVPYRVGSFPFAANGRAQAMEVSGGKVRILAHAESDRILGAHIIGPHASELIAELVLAMEFEASVEDVARTIHAHPTLTEAIREAALAVDGRAIHQHRS